MRLEPEANLELPSPSHPSTDDVQDAGAFTIKRDAAPDEASPADIARSPIETPGVEPLPQNEPSDLPKGDLEFSQDAHSQELPAGGELQLPPAPMAEDGPPQAGQNLTSADVLTGSEASPAGPSDQMRAATETQRTEPPSSGETPPHANPPAQEKSPLTDSDSEPLTLQRRADAPRAARSPETNDR